MPKDQVGDIEFLISLLDWEANVDPNFAANHFMRPRPVRPVEQMRAEGYEESWITYRSTAFSAKELTVLPGRTVTIKDAAAYGMILLQGHGTMGPWDIDSPAVIRFGQLTMDEFFVTEDTATGGREDRQPVPHRPAGDAEAFRTRKPRPEDVGGFGALGAAIRAGAPMGYSSWKESPSGEGMTRLLSRRSDDAHPMTAWPRPRSWRTATRATPCPSAAWWRIGTRSLPAG